MSQTESIISIAKNQIGYREGANNDSKYGAWYGLNHNPYCAMFVSWCASQAGIATDIVPRFASCPIGKAWFASRGRYKARSGYTPKKGDVIFYNWNGDGTADHTGLVVDVSGGNVITVEGNTTVGKGAEGVYQKTRSQSYSCILGYGIPNYETAGDVDGDGKVTSADALKILNAAVGKQSVNSNGDMNNDGHIGADDALSALKISVGK